MPWTMIIGEEWLRLWGLWLACNGGVISSGLSVIRPRPLLCVATSQLPPSVFRQTQGRVERTKLSCNDVIKHLLFLPNSAEWKKYLNFHMLYPQPRWKGTIRGFLSLLERWSVASVEAAGGFLSKLFLSFTDSNIQIWASNFKIPRAY